MSDGTNGTTVDSAKTGSEISNGTIVDPAKYRGKVLTIAIAGYAFDGMDIMVFALAAPLLLNAWPDLKIVQLGFIATCMLLGMSFGGYIFGPIADKYGRKKALVWCIAFFGLMTGLTGFCTNYIQMGVMRFLAGLGLGAEWALGGTLLQEFAEPAKRAKFSSYMTLGWPIGWGLTIAAGYFLTPIYGWQLLYYMGTAAIFLAIYIHYAIPESPIWMKMQQARTQGIAAGAPIAQAGTKDLFKKENIRSFLYVVLICTSMLCTYWAVNTWLPTILARERGMSPKAYSTLLMALTGVGVIFYFIGGWCGDKFGKRPTMAACGILAAITLVLWLGIEWEEDWKFNMFAALAWAPPSCIWAILAAYVVEQFPTNIRAVGMAAGFSTGRLVATLIPLVMGAAAQQIGLTVVMTAVAVFYVIAAIGVLMLRDSKAHI